MRSAVLLSALALAFSLAGCGHEPTPEEAAASSAGASARVAEAMKPSGLDDVSILNTAYQQCIAAIAAKLKAPATARFSDRAPANEGREGGSFYFRGTVDSENGFGALLRSDWACQVDYELAANSYTTVIADVA